ncbi:DapH/DapD/GlmU-related protein [Emticicia agri]|nr:DapH/DapD/GlmU-related protein [Emticicia agri]
MSRIDFGKALTTGRGCRLEVVILENNLQEKKLLIFGSNIQLNDYVHITAAEKVILEDNVLIASKVYISDCSHGTYGKFDINDHPDTIPKDRKLYSMPVTIKKNVWIGEGVCVLMGVTIGEGSIIGSNAVVSKDIPSYSIAVGNPAKVIKKFDTNQQKWISV